MGEWAELSLALGFKAAAIAKHPIHHHGDDTGATVCHHRPEMLPWTVEHSSAQRVSGHSGCSCTGGRRTIAESNHNAVVCSNFHFHPMCGWRCTLLMPMHQQRAHDNIALFRGLMVVKDSHDGETQHGRRLAVLKRREIWGSDRGRQRVCRQLGSRPTW